MSQLGRKPKKENQNAQNSATSGARAPVRINPVTGKMTVAKDEPLVNAKGEELVRDGGLLIPKKYLNAAVEAGCGSSNGMYSHMSGVQRSLQSEQNTGRNRGGSGARRAKVREPTVKRVGNVHMISTSSSSSKSTSAAAPRRRNNIKQVVQGRSRGIGAGRSGGAAQHESSFTRQKGVVATMGGACDVRHHSRTVERRGERKTGIAQIGTGSGGRSFVKMNSGGGGGGAGMAAAAAKRATAKGKLTSAQPLAATTAPRRPSVTKKLGGGGSSSCSSGKSMTQEEMRAVRLKRFG